MHHSQPWWKIHWAPAGQERATALHTTPTVLIQTSLDLYAYWITDYMYVYMYMYMYMCKCVFVNVCMREERA